jgi:hypothetical protein
MQTARRKRAPLKLHVWRRLVLHDPTLSQTEKIVAHVLADHLNADGSAEPWGSVTAPGCGPSYARIARLASVHRRSAMRAVKRLEDSGWLRRTYTAPEGRGHTNRWVIGTPEPNAKVEDDLNVYDR